MKTKTCASKKLLLGLILLAFTQVISAQNFTEVMGTPLIGIAASSVAFADIDGDNDQDVLMTGATLNDRVSKLYTNDGAGNFTEVPDTPFEGVAFSSVAFADVDGDNDPDLLLTGASMFNLHSIMYINDGAGNFSALPNTPFEPINNGSIAFVDVDGDGDQDVLMTGQNLSLTNHISKLYINDGTGSFTEVMNTPFVGTIYSSMAFADVDGDNDMDVLITGQDDALDPISKLYTNDGSGNFSEVMDVPFAGVSEGSIAFADVDGDNDQDVLITGSFSSILYTNDGSGNFTEVVDTPFDPAHQSSIAFADADGDSDLDVLITGMNDSYAQIAKLYNNDGAGNYAEVAGTPFAGVDESSIAFSDVDGDNDLDVLITGLGEGSLGHISKLYLNDGVLSSSDNYLTHSGMHLTPFPNPVTSSNLYLHFESTESKPVMVRIYDLRGNPISEQSEFTGTGEQLLEVDISSLTPGTYFIQMENGGKQGTAKFMVQ